MIGTRVEVGGPAPCPVLIGSGLLPELPGLVAGATRAAIVHPPTLGALAEQARARLADHGLAVSLLSVPDGEAAKTLMVAGACWDALGAAGFTRTDAVVGLGGGATTDIAGWVAAGWLRGVRVIHVPTSLVGMVDAAIGGKTAINTDRGKNLVGAFHPPAGVLCDLDLLATLPPADYAAGLAEVVKCGFIADPAILDLVERDADTVTKPGNPAERELVERAVAVKARVVAEDLTETGLREILNYGHTLGHAIERAENYRWRHGEAVAVGLVYAAALARRARHLDAPTARRHRAILSRLGLPTRYCADAFEQLLAGMRIDKKARGDRLRFIVLDGLASPVTLDDPDPALLADAYTEVADD